MKFNSRIKLIYVGKVKKDFNQKAILYYNKIISKYANLNRIEIKDVKDKNIEKIKTKEGEEIIKKVEDRDYLFLMDEQGKQFSSKELAKKLEETIIYQQKNPVFIIGGPYGHGPLLKEKADLILSLSKMTLPHELAQVVLLEQIYRALTIINGHPYHNV